MANDLTNPPEGEREIFARWKALLAYDPNTGALVWKPRGVAFWDARNAGNEAGALCPNTGYRYLTLDGARRLAHRVVWALAHGHMPEGQIDHINGKRDDNRLCNLRDVTAAENRRNMAIGSANKSGVLGVSWDISRGVWIATIRDQGGRSRTIGRFSDLNRAKAARRAAERRYGYHENHGGRSVG